MLRFLIFFFIQFYAFAVLCKNGSCIGKYDGKCINLTLCKNGSCIGIKGGVDEVKWLGDFPTNVCGGSNNGNILNHQYQLLPRLHQCNFQNQKS